MTTLDLRCVTLVCFENKNHRAALSLLSAMCRMADFGDVRLMNQHTDYDGFTRAEFDAFRTVRTTHIMYCHLDGYILRPELWNPEWLKYDYIGAPWPVSLLEGRFPLDLRVGNGGFSLRTKRLAEASADMGFNAAVQNDVLVCCIQRPLLEFKGFKWAPVTEAARFSTELPCPETQPESFGFHKHGPIWSYN